MSSTLQLAALLAAALTLLLSWPDDKKESSGSTAVIVSLVLAAMAGATAVAGARDVGSWLVGLELATLPTIALVALRGARSAISGAIALLTTALVSFGLLALSAALWFTATGTGFGANSTKVVWPLSTALRMPCVKYVANCFILPSESSSLRRVARPEPSPLPSRFGPLPLPQGKSP